MKTLLIKGLNINRFLNEIIQQKITPLKITRSQYDEIIIEIKNKDYKKLLALNIVACYNINVVKSTPTYPIFTMLLKRMGLFVGIIISLFFLNAKTSKIWGVNIIVNGENFSEQIEQKVQEVLASSGVVEGSRFSHNTRELERELTAKIDESSSILVKRRGIYLDVYVNLRVIKPEPNSQNIVSLYDGKITDINLTSGILAVNIGEGVHKGQVLIMSGTVGDFYTEAIGDITAKVLISGEAVGSIQTESMIRTGRYKEVVGFRILSKTFSKKIEEVASDFNAYEVEESEVLISFNNALPIKKVVYKIYELEPKTISISKEDLIKNLKSQSYITAKNNLPSGAVIEDVSYSVFENNSVIKVVCNIKTEVQIGTRK